MNTNECQMYRINVMLMLDGKICFIKTGQKSTATFHIQKRQHKKHTKHKQQKRKNVFLNNNFLKETD